MQLTSVRKTIARRLTEAWTAPVFQLGVSVDMTEALHLREQLVARLAEGDVKPTVNDVLDQARRRRADAASGRERHVRRGEIQPFPVRTRGHRRGGARTGSSCP